MSFVDMMANDVWSNADIDAKVQAMIRSRYSENDELKAARLTRSGDGSDFVAAVDSWISQCVAEGRDARDDMALLLQVFDVENAQRRLDQPVLEPEYDEENNVTNQDALDQDAAERDAAQDVIDNASPEAMAVVEQRKPPVVEGAIEDSNAYVTVTTDT
jgi:hypothetical protein